MRFEKSLQHWQTPAFTATLQAELMAMNPELLPLQQGLRNGSFALPEKRAFTLIAAEETPGLIRLRLGLYYSSIIAGCSCADDPTPLDELPEYCVLQVLIDKATAEVSVSLLDED